MYVCARVSVSQPAGVCSAHVYPYMYTRDLISTVHSLSRLHFLRGEGCDPSSRVSGRGKRERELFMRLFIRVHCAAGSCKIEVARVYVCWVWGFFFLEAAGARFDRFLGVRRIVYACGRVQKLRMGWE